MIRRSQPLTPGGNVPFADQAWLKSCPLLCSYLADEFWDDGQSRQPSTLTIKQEDGRLNMALNDRDEGASLYVTADDVSRGLKALEKALESSNPDWRRWSGGGKKKKA